MFITIEGIDGTGKSSLAKALAERLGQSRVLLTREPTDASPWGRRLREAATQGRLSHEEEIDHFHRDRLHHLESVIKPALAAGKIVISDRYVDSTLAYQAASPQDADRLYAQMTGDLLEPDIVLILECPVRLALKRIGKGRSAHSRFELEETLNRAAQIYKSRPGARYHHIDASRPFRDVLAAALAAIESHATPRGPKDG